MSCSAKLNCVRKYRPRKLEKLSGSISSINIAFKIRLILHSETYGRNELYTCQLSYNLIIKQNGVRLQKNKTFKFSTKLFSNKAI